MTHSKQNIAVLYTAVFLLSLNGLFSKLIPLDAVTTTGLRSVIAAVAIFAFALTRRRSIRLNNEKQTVSVYIIGVLMGLHWITFFHSMQISTVAVGMISLFTYPVMTVLLEPFFTKTKWRLADLVAGIIVLIGILVMVNDELHSVDSHLIQGVFFGALSALLFTLRNLLQKYWHPDVSSDSLMFHQVIAIAIMLALFIDLEAVTAITLTEGLLLLLLGVVSTATAHSFLSFCLKHFSAKSVAMISSLQPLFAALFAWLVLNEKPTLAIVLGGAIIIGVALFESIKKGKNNQSRAA